MKTLIIYGSKYGFTEDCARELKNKIDGEVNLLSISKAEKESLDVAENGGSKTDTKQGFAERRSK